jgi:hypothetical protein
MKKAAMALVVLLAAGVGACGGKEEAGKAEGKASEAVTGSIGVPECDAYFSEAEACMKKDANMRVAMEGSMKTNRAQWKKTAETKEGKEQLKVLCKLSSDQLKLACH